MGRGVRPGWGIVGRFAVFREAGGGVMTRERGSFGAPTHTGEAVDYSNAYSVDG